MPVISFDIGELTKEQKEILAKEFSESASRVTGLPIEIRFKSHRPSDRNDICAVQRKEI